MKFSKSGKLMATLALAVASIGSVQATVITVDGGAVYQGDCTFACVQHYQQAYDSSIFSAPVSINSVSFIVSNYGGSWNAGNLWQMSLSTSANQVGSLSSTFSNNVGSDNSVFATQSFSGSAAAGSLLTFTGLFNYNPLAGDLLIDIVAQGSVGGPSLQYNYQSNGAFGRVYAWNAGATGYVGQNYGNVTQFGFGNQVPEPATLALVSLGLLGFGLGRRKK